MITNNEKVVVTFQMQQQPFKTIGQPIFDNNTQL